MVESLQDNTHIMIVEGLTFRDYKDVVQINYDKLVHHVPKDVIYEILEGCWGVAQPKQHDQVAIHGPEGSPSFSLLPETSPGYKLHGGPTL